MHDESLEDVQSKIAYLERSLLELSDVVFRQQQEIQLLEARLDAVKQRQDDAGSGEAALSAEQERPPHY
jgi:SlyX protein